MESWCVQLSIDVPYVSIGAVVVSLDAPKHQTVTSLGHVCDPSCSNSDHTAGPHWTSPLQITHTLLAPDFTKSSTKL